MADSKRKTANLFDAETAYGVLYNNGVISGELSALAAIKNTFPAELIGQQVTISVTANAIQSNRAYIRCSIDGSNIDSNAITQGNTGTLTVTITPTSTSDKWWFTYGSGTGSNTFSNLMLNTGSSSLPYELYGWLHSLRKLGTATDTITTLPADIYTDGQPIGANLWDGVIGTDNVILNQNGSPTPNDNYALSAYIPVLPSTSYVYHFYHNSAENRSTYTISLYDSSKSVITPMDLEWITENRDYDITFTTTSNTAYIRINWKKAYDENMMLIKGNTPIPYQPYAPTIVKGNTSQSGTPTPSSPITPSECGDMTGNLFDEDYPNISGTIQYRPIYVGEGSFTLSTTTPYDSSVANVFLLSGNVSSGASTSGNGAWLNHKVTTQSIDGYVTIAYRHYSGTTSPETCDTMLNSGSTALPYEPYGIKIPILSANTTTPVYLGEVQSTRKIKKLVFDGTEDWTKNDVGNPSNYLYYQTGYLANKTCVCSHLEDMGTLSTSKVGVFNGNNVLYLNFGSAIMNAQPSGNTVEGLKQYLAAQYAAGTPVCVWYVLADSTTGIVNEPLRKIGDYADTVSGISIPTITGADSFDVLTTLKPSEVSLSYTGWHDASVKEWDGSQWQ